jgi:hypothetical protein
MNLLQSGKDAQFGTHSHPDEPVGLLKYKLLLERQLKPNGLGRWNTRR